MNCKKCGKILEKDEIICSRCGKDNSKLDIISSMKKQLETPEMPQADFNNIKQVEEVKIEDNTNQVEQINMHQIESNREVINTKTADFDTITNMDEGAKKVKNPIPLLVVIIFALLIAIIFVKIEIDKYQLEHGRENEISIEDLELKERTEGYNQKNNSIQNSMFTNNVNEVDNIIADENTVAENKTKTDNSAKTNSVIEQERVNQNILNEMIANSTERESSKRNATITSTYITKKVNE